MNQYPSWRYHYEHSAQLVNNEQEDEALSEKDGWTDEPYSEEEKKLKKKLPKVIPPPAKVNKAAEQPTGRYTHQNYPSWRYHPTEKPVLVSSKDEDTDLLESDNEWSDTPVKKAEKQQEEPKKADEKQPEEPKKRGKKK